jgi:phage baseplate assembly protein W
MPNLTLSSSVSQSYVTNARGRVASVTVTVSLTDDRVFVTSKPVGLTLDWGDGSQIETVVKSQSPYSGTFQHTYTVGTYVLKITGANYRVPLPDTAIESHDIQVVSATPRIPTLADQGLQPIIFGPILPRDEGFPNQSEWAFQTSQDSVVLESSARMLLVTAVGDRLMELDYGTNLPLRIFEPSSPNLQDDVSQELVRAFSVHEPRLVVSSVNLTAIGEKQVRVSVSLVSKLDQRQFVVSATFVQS